MVDLLGSVGKYNMVHQLIHLYSMLLESWRCTSYLYIQRLSVKNIREAAKVFLMCTILHNMALQRSMHLLVEKGLKSHGDNTTNEEPARWAQCCGVQLTYASSVIAFIRSWCALSLYIVSHMPLWSPSPLAFPTARLHKHPVYKGKGTIPSSCHHKWHVCQCQHSHCCASAHGHTYTSISEIGVDHNSFTRYSAISYFALMLLLYNLSLIWVAM